MDTAEVVKDLLTHHGVKGMRWGVRRKATVGPREVIISDKRKKIKTKGGEGHPASADAVRARTSGQIAKKSGYKALSDQQLREYTNRLNLEANAKRLDYAEKPAAKKFVAQLLGQTGKNAATQAANEVASQQVKKHVIRKLAVGAAAAAV
jgi:hypothetical protein